MIVIMEDEPNTMTNEYGSEDEDESSRPDSSKKLAVEQEDQMIAKDEHKAVIRLRLLLLLVLLGSTVGFAFATHYYVSRFETTALEEQFQADATKVLSSVGASLDFTMGAVDSLVVNMVSYAHESQSKWPFVTVPDFAVRAAKIKALSNALLLAVYPVVKSDTRSRWERYTVNHDAWVKEGMTLQEKDGSFRGAMDFNFSETTPDLGIITDNNGVRPSNYTTYLPQWQMHPVFTTFAPYNWDLLSDSAISSFDSVFGSQEVILSPAYQLPDPNDPWAVAETEAYVSFYADFVGPGQDASEPISDIWYPILDSAVSSLQTSTTSSDPRGETSHLVGILALPIVWADAIKEVGTQQKSGGGVVKDDPRISFFPSLFQCGACWLVSSSSFLRSCRLGPTVLWWFLKMSVIQPLPTRLTAPPSHIWDGVITMIPSMTT
jgi:hypothetical protein